MKRRIVTVLIILIGFLFQCTVFKTLSIGSISPNLMVIITSSFGFMKGKKEGLWVGFFCGLLEDIFYGRLLGMHAVIYMYIGYTNGKFNRLFFPDDIKLPLLLIFLSDLAYGLLYYITLFLMRSRFQIDFYFLHIILPEIVYTLLMTLLLYPLIL